VASLDDVALKLECCNRREYKGSPLDVSRVSPDQTQPSNLQKGAFVLPLLPVANDEYLVL